MLGGRKSGRFQSNLGDDLLRRLGPDPRDFDQTCDRGLILLHLGGRQLVHVIDLAVDQLNSVPVLA